jgi:hypothetical protein
MTVDLLAKFEFILEYWKCYFRYVSKVPGAPSVVMVEVPGEYGYNS